MRTIKRGFEININLIMKSLNTISLHKKHSSVIISFPKGSAFSSPDVEGISEFKGGRDSIQNSSIKVPDTD